MILPGVNFALESYIGWETNPCFLVSKELINSAMLYQLLEKTEIYFLYS